MKSGLLVYDVNTDVNVKKVKMKLKCTNTNLLRSKHPVFTYLVEIVITKKNKFKFYLFFCSVSTPDISALQGVQ